MFFWNSLVFSMIFLPYLFLIRSGHSGQSLELGGDKGQKKIPVQATGLGQSVGKLVPKYLNGHSIGRSEEIPPESPSVTERGTP